MFVELAVVAARRTLDISPTSQTWCSTIRISRSMESPSLGPAAAGRRVDGNARRSARRAGSASARRHAAGADAVRPGERPGERLVRAVAGLDGDVEHGPVAWSRAGTRPARAAPAAGTGPAARRPTATRPVEMEPRQVQPRGQVLAGRSWSSSASASTSTKLMKWSAAVPMCPSSGHEAPPRLICLAHSFPGRDGTFGTSR